MQNSTPIRNPQRNSIFSHSPGLSPINGNALITPRSDSDALYSLNPRSMIGDNSSYIDGGRTDESRNVSVDTMSYLQEQSFLEQTAPADSMDLSESDSLLDGIRHVSSRFTDRSTQTDLSINPFDVTYLVSLQTANAETQAGSVLLLQTNFKTKPTRFDSSMEDSRREKNQSFRTQSTHNNRTFNFVSIPVTPQPSLRSGLNHNREFGTSLNSQYWRNRLQKRNLISCFF